MCGSRMPLAGRSLSPSSCFPIETPRRANASPQRFLAAITDTQTVDEGMNLYALLLLSPDDLGRAITKALKHPLPDEED